MFKLGQKTIDIIQWLFIVFLGIFPDIKNSNLYSLFGVLSFFSLLIFSVIYVLETIITVMKESTYTFLLMVIPSDVVLKSNSTSDKSISSLVSFDTKVSTDTLKSLAIFTRLS